MKEPVCRFEALSDKHDRTAFHCGEEALDRYFRTQATQDSRRNIANCFVAVEVATGQVAGYYTLSATSIAPAELPLEETRRLPRYSVFPAILIGRLATDEKFQGRGLGEELLLNATARLIRGAAAFAFFIVDAKNERAAAFYQRNGFRSIPDQPRKLYLSLATAKKALLGG